MSYQISGCTHPAIWRPGLNQRERPIRDLAESVSILFMRGHLAARARAFEPPMQMVRILAQRDHVHSNTVLLERELAIETQPNNASTTRRRNDSRDSSSCDFEGGHARRPQIDLPLIQTPFRTGESRSETNTSMNPLSTHHSGTSPIVVCDGLSRR